VEAKFPQDFTELSNRDKAVAQACGIMASLSQAHFCLDLARRSKEQPGFYFISLPFVRLVPLPGLPIGVQIITAPWREDVALRIAYALEASGVLQTPRLSLQEAVDGSRLAGNCR
jgi:hypothetical protein